MQVPKLSILAGLALLIAAGPLSLAADKPITVDPAKVPKAHGDSVDIVVTADPDLVKRVSATIVRVQAADSTALRPAELGMSLAAADPAESAASEPGGGAAGGVTIGLEGGKALVRLAYSPSAARDRLRRPGDVGVTLRFSPLDDEGEPAESKNKPIPPVEASVTFARPGGTLETKHTEKRAFRLWRSLPEGSTGRREGTLRLVETSGKTDLTGVRIEALPPHADKGAPGRPGSVEDLPGEEGNPALTIPAGSSADVDFTFVDFRHPGSFEVDLLVDSPDLAAPVLLPIQVTVKDWWPVPLLIITLGVVGALVLRRYTKQLPAARKISRSLRQIEAGASALESSGLSAKSGTETQAEEIRKEARDLLAKNRYHWTSKEKLVDKTAALEAKLKSAVATGQTAVPSLAGAKSSVATRQIARSDSARRAAKATLAGADEAAADAGLQPGDYLLAAVAVALAVLTAVHSLYLGKPFGTVKDYAGAFLWGFGTEVGIKALSDLIQTVKKRLG